MPSLHVTTVSRAGVLNTFGAVPSTQELQVDLCQFLSLSAFCGDFAGTREAASWVR